MTKVIAVLNPKGGSGKTTVAINLAYALQRGGENVLLVDCDPQGTTRDWNDKNGGEVLPVIGLDRETLDKDLEAVKAGYDWIILDGAPSISKRSTAAIKAADMILIPCTPSPYDVWACEDLVNIIAARQDVTGGSPRAAFLISRAIKNTLLAAEVVEALTDYELPVFSSGTTNRQAYPTTARDGLTVFANPESPAAQEIDNIKRELLDFMSAVLWT